MKSKLITIVLGLALVPCSLFSQYSYENFNKDKNLNLTLDSIYYFYARPGDTIDVITNVRYYKFENNVLQIKYISNANFLPGTYEPFLSATDSLFYSQSNQVDSSIVENERDGEWDEYALKHIYTYNNGLLRKDSILVDVYDTFHNKWHLKNIYWYQYDKKGRLICEQLGYIKNKYYYNDESNLRIDSCFAIYDTTFYPHQVIKNYYTDGLLTLYKSWVLGSKDTLIMQMIYNEKKQITSCYTDNKYAFTYEYANEVPTRTEFSYDDTNNTMSETFFRTDGKNWRRTNETIYYFKANVSSSTVQKSISVSIFPNPAKDYLTIEWSEPAGAGRLFNASGQLMRKFSLLKGTNTLNINSLNSGIYILQLPKQNGLFIKKIIKN